MSKPNIDNADTGFIKLMFGVEDQIVSDKLSATDIVVFLYLAMNVNYRNNIAQYANGKNINKKDIVEKRNMGKSSVYRSINKLIEKRYIREMQGADFTFIVVNPRYARKSNNIDPQIYELFDWKQNT